MYCFPKWIKFAVKQTNTKKVLENWKKYWKSQGILSVRKSGNPDCIELFSISEIISAAALEIEREEERKKFLTSYAVASSPSRKRRRVELKESHEHNSEGKGR